MIWRPWAKGIGGALLALVGLVWIGQGLGLPLGRSFMIGRIEWAVAGLVCLALGAGLLWSALQPAPPRSRAAERERDG